MIHILEAGARWALRGVFVAGALVVPMAGCDSDKLVEVENPAERAPEEVSGPEAVPALVAGAFRQFVGGYSGFGLDDSFLSMSAVISDEFYWGDTFGTRQAADRRTLFPPTLANISDPAYDRLHQARFNARRAFVVIGQFSTPETAAEDAVTQSELRTIEAYTYVTLSEGWCGSVPFSTVPDTGLIDPARITPGDPLTTAAMNDTAVVRFNEALALDGGNLLAAMGKGRALLNNGRYSEAAAAVQNVPTTFVFHTEHSTNVSSQNNPINSLQSNGRYGVSNLEGGVTATGAFLRPDLRTPPASAASAEGLPFRALRDPRVPWEGRDSPANRCFSSAATCWLDNNYPILDADVPIASGVEARLIEAEADLQAGNGPAMIARLNALRASVAVLLDVLYPDQKQVFPPPPGTETLAPLVDPGTPAGRRDLLFSERALWLYLTGHRQGDLRRLVRQYGLLTTQVFPSGPYFRAGNFGNDVAYPVPFNEENNPKFIRAGCVTTQA